MTCNTPANITSVPYALTRPFMHLSGRVEFVRMVRSKSIYNEKIGSGSQHTKQKLLYIRYSIIEVQQCFRDIKCTDG